MIIVGRPIDGITLNTEIEYLLKKKDGNVMKFLNEKEARNFLRENGISDENMGDMIFAEI